MKSEKQNLIDFYSKYIVLAEKRYGKLPEHCYHTTFKHGVCPETGISGANCVYNVCYINPKSIDPEASVFHEMEHIRTAHMPYDNPVLVGIVEYSFEKNEYLGEALNEALTEISVEILLGRKSKPYAHFETTVLAKQIGAVLGFTNDQLLKFYTKGGRINFIQAFANLVCEQIRESSSGFRFGVIGSFEELELIHGSLHRAHLDDMNKEHEKYGKITEPLGICPSEQTTELRKLFQGGLMNRLKQGLENRVISQDEFDKRTQRVSELSPYI